MFERSWGGLRHEGTAIRHASGKVRRIVLRVGLSFIMAPAGSAVAETTIGQLGGGFGCTGGRLPAVLGDMSYVVPRGGGTITSFSFDSDSSNAGQQVEFLVLRPMGGGNYSVTGKTGLVTLKGTGIERFPTSSRAEAGDVLGIWSPGSVENCAHVDSGAIFDSGAFATDPDVGEMIATHLLIDGFDLNELASFAPSLSRMRASAKLIRVPRVCVRAFSPEVKGKGIASVKWSLDGNRIIGRVVRRGTRYAATISLRPGSHRLLVRVSFKARSHTPARMFRRTVTGCRRTSWEPTRETGPPGDL
jgi:hypothetical protein